MMLPAAIKRISWRGVATLALTLLGSVPATAGEWGDLRGRFVVDGKVAPVADLVGPPNAVLIDESFVVDVSGSLRNAIIYLRSKTTEIPPTYQRTANDQVQIDVKNNRFLPHVVVLRTSQNLMLVNSDAVAYSLQLESLQNQPASRLLPVFGKSTLTLPYEEPLPVRLGSTITPWLRAWVLVRNSPYSATSTPQGKFMIRDLPAGVELEFQLWQEVPGPLRDVAYSNGRSDHKGRIKVTLRPGNNDLGDLRVPARLFESKK